MCSSVMSIILKFQFLESVGLLMEGGSPQCEQGYWRPTHNIIALTLSRKQGREKKNHLGGSGTWA